jgi:predicted membrane protein
MPCGAKTKRTESTAINAMNDEQRVEVNNPMHLPSLFLAVLIMVVGTVYPPLMTNHLGQADHGIAFALLYAMAAGFVRGVGFVPVALVWRTMFSFSASLLAFGLAIFLIFKGSLQ